MNAGENQPIKFLQASTSKGEGTKIISWDDLDRREENRLCANFDQGIRKLLGLQSRTSDQGALPTRQDSCNHLQ